REVRYRAIGISDRIRQYRSNTALNGIGEGRGNPALEFYSRLNIFSDRQILLMHGDIEPLGGEIKKKFL
ncbi:MAG: hypothetical protein AAB932_02670, partial [Patescibacteria group bacterium]